LLSARKSTTDFFRQYRWASTRPVLMCILGCLNERERQTWEVNQIKFKLKSWGVIHDIALYLCKNTVVVIEQL
jgi:hypothetical protein